MYLYMCTHEYMCMGAPTQDPSAAPPQTPLQRPRPPVLLFDVELTAAVQARPCSDGLGK